MYSETVEPSGNKKKLFWRLVIVLFAVAVVMFLAQYFGFYPGLVSLAALFLGAIGFYGEYKRVFVYYTYVLNEGTLYIDRRVGSVDAIVAELKKEEILSLEKISSVPEGEGFYGGENREIYRLTYPKGSFYFTPGRGLLARLSGDWEE